ncbi:condensin-2 complex subunit H2-like protein isoform X2 [Tasmannia lanceolata]|uniref:condensin-2 complex subunit H2-like protein isoform X2 n=1 Tax=Tasmannia lanceolata TaxID=3420 RepID=UPI004063B2EA
MNDKEQRGGEESSRFHFLQPNRDPQSNFAVDLAKHLEDYLLKICSGEINGNENSHNSVNFVEAALVIQDSIQVYSRKVEYLYSLVLHALEFISQKRPDQQEETSTQPDRHDSSTAGGEEIETFLGLDDVPVEPNTCLDDGRGGDGILNQFVKPPANLLVLEGDSLDTSGDSGELESYLLATSTLYRDFLLLDPCDAGAVDDFLKGNNVGEQNVGQRGSSARSKTHRSFLQSPKGRSVGSAHKPNFGNDQEDNLNRFSGINSFSTVNDNNRWSQSHIEQNLSKNDVYDGEPMDGGFSEHGNDSDDDVDPWKPLNPHEPGNLKVKAFKKGKNHGRCGISYTNRNAVREQFPLARLNATVNPEFAEKVEERLHARERSRASQSPPIYEKLRQSLVLGEDGNFDSSDGIDDENQDNGFGNDLPDFDQGDVGLQDGTFMDMDVPLPHEKPAEDNANLSGNEAFGQEEPSSQASLEDLCRSHLDALLARIAEAEKQTELATRVSTWKQRIEKIPAHPSIFMYTVREFSTNYHWKQTVNMACPFPILSVVNQSMMLPGLSRHFCSW